MSEQWLTVAEAAYRLKVSERTVQRRCKSGKLAARLEANAEGSSWLIDGSKLPTAAAIGAATDDRAPTTDDTASELEAVQSVVTLPTSADKLPTGDANAFTAHLLAENAFLRGLVEQRDRDAAELRAALREALKMSNRAIMPADSKEPSQAPQSTQNPPAGSRVQPAKQAAQKPTESPAAALWRKFWGVR